MNLDPKSELQELNTITEEIEVGGSRKAIIIIALFLQLKSFQKNPSPVNTQIGQKVQWDAHCLYLSEENAA